MTAGNSRTVRLNVLVKGIVQGVGFRPFVYNLAVELGLSGSVTNSGGLVAIELEGNKDKVECFLADLRSKAPLLSVIDDVVTREVEPEGSSAFEILASKALPAEWQAVPPDSACCPDCLADVFEPGNRRYRYPFTNCTNCGPRFTVIKDLPYDRPLTSMAGFKMCAQCQAEYEDPANRRFHAQPNCCSVCGPSLTYVQEDSERLPISYKGEQALRQASLCLQAGGILAVKGLGGFHLSCLATSEESVAKLRRRKKRYAKPLAVMFPDLSCLREYCLLSRQAESVLSGSACPIVLLPCLPDAGKQLAPSVAFGLGVLGAMLPYTPLHHLLLSDCPQPLVMTSGNVSDEPICIDNDEASEQLCEIADAFLFHDRKIEARYDDSVVSMVHDMQIMIRRARGFAPVPLKLPFAAAVETLSFGAHLKNTFCLVKSNRGFVSQHIGDLENLETMEHFQAALSKYCQLFKLAPRLIACDLHPDYLSSRLAQDFARENQLPLIAVQHHHAHIAACMAEHGLSGEVIGVAFDGLGFGLDGTFWGGEFLLATPADFRRVACLKPVPMPGGQQAIKQPWRMALSYLFEAGENSRRYCEEYTREAGEIAGQKTVALVKQQLERKLNAPLTSSCGRLFDAMSAVLAISFQSAYEGEAAIALQSAAEQYLRLKKAEPASLSQPLLFTCRDPASDSAPFSIDPSTTLLEAFRLRLDGIPVEAIAFRFHQGLAALVLKICRRIRSNCNVETVCLSGGVFQNALLLEMVVDLLGQDEFKVFFPRLLPPNDGGLSLGQAYVALSKSGNILDA